MITHIFSPHIAHAASVGQLVGRIEDVVINPIVGILFAIAFLIFVWGIVRFLFNADDENARAQGKQHILWGLVGMFIMIAVKAIITIITSTIGIPAVV